MSNVNMVLRSHKNMLLCSPFFFFSFTLFFFLNICSEETHYVVWQVCEVAFFQLYSNVK